MIAKRGLKIALLAGLLASLMACEGSDELDDTLSRDAEMTFVNTLTSMSDFYVEKRNISLGYSGLFNSDNIVSRDVPQNSVGETYSYQYKAISNLVNLGVKDSNNNEQKNHHVLSAGDKLWVIAWGADGDEKLSVLAKKQNNQADTFNIRVFADGSYVVAVDGNQVVKTKAGEVTDYLTVNNCVDELVINGATIDLCSGDFGQSYLLVVDAKGKRVMAKE
jgi:hypothetical protein